jgi:hypothetical protein
LTLDSASSRGSDSIGSGYDHITSSDLSASVTATSGPVAEASDKKARLLYCKSSVSIHPTSFSKDNIKGYLGVVEVDAPGASVVDKEGNVSGGSAGGKELLVTWVPEEVVQRMDEGDRAGYKKVDSWTSAEGDKEEDGKSPGQIAIDARFRIRLHPAAQGRKLRIFRSRCPAVQYPRLLCELPHHKSVGRQLT